MQTPLSPADLVALIVIAIAVLRGVSLGLIREVFSIGALAAAVIAGRWFASDAGYWLREASDRTMGETLSGVLGGVLVGLVVLLVVTTLGRLLGRGAHAVGLGFADRIGGAAVGAAEGAVVVALLLLLTIAAVGRDHPVIAGSRSLDALEEAETWTRGYTAPEESGDVAAPPRSG